MGQLLAEELEQRLNLGAGTDWFDEQNLTSGVQRRIMHASYPPAYDSGYPSSVGSHSPNEQISRKPTPEPICASCLLANRRSLYQAPHSLKTVQPGIPHSTTIGQSSTVATQFPGQHALKQSVGINSGSDRRGRIIRGRPAEDACSRYQTTDAFFSRATMTMANRLQAQNHNISSLTDFNASLELYWNQLIENQSQFEQPSPMRQESNPTYTHIPHPIVGRLAYPAAELDSTDLWKCGFEGQFRHQSHEMTRAVTKQDVATQWAISKNIRYKTKTCLHWEKLGNCPAGKHCQFAHGASDLRQAKDHPKFRTQLCVHFASTGYCPYEDSCFFRHLKMSHWPGDLSSSN